MERLSVLGTGYAIASRCYTACFTVSDGAEHFMLDSGGGSGVLTQLEKLAIAPSQVKHIFLSHKHADHILGAVWLLRMAEYGVMTGRFSENLHLYAPPEVADGLEQMCRFMLSPRFATLLGERILLHRLADGDRYDILGRQVDFFDAHSRKDVQFGARIRLDNGRTLTYLGDEPFQPAAAPYAQGADYLIHEAMCREAEAELFQPHRIMHSTVRDAAEQAERLGVGNLILFHTADNDLAQRKLSYSAEAQRYFSGRVYVPDDLDIIELS